MVQNEDVLSNKKNPFISPKKAFFATVLLVTLTMAGFLLYNIERLLVLQENPVRSDAIVVLLGGLRPERVRQAKTLLNHSIAPYIIFGSGFRKLEFSWKNLPSYKWSPGGERYMRQLLALGVQKAKLIEVDTPLSYDSESEIQQLLVFIRSKKWNKITLVTSASHSRRAKLIWDRLSPDIKAKVVAAPEPALKNWWKTRQGRRTVIHEILGYVKEFGRRARVFPSYALSSK